jgi:hypothetical protein
MPRYIDADVLCNVLKKSAADEWNKRALAETWSYAYQDMIDTIENEPSADVELVRHGKWEIKLGFLGEKYSECSYCRYDISNNDVPKHILKYDYKYCPNCGAKMDKEK